MIKISKDFMFLWSRIFPGYTCIVGVFFVVICIKFNLLPIYGFLIFMFFIQLFVIKIWRLWKIQEVFVDINLPNDILFVAANGDELRISKNNIIKCKTYFGITDVRLLIGENSSTVYCMIASKQNLIYLNPDN